MRTSIVYYLLTGVLFLSLFSACKSAKLSDAEEKQRIGEYYEAAAIYRKIYTKTSPKKRDLRGYIAFRMAECNRLINNTGKATSAYLNAIRYDYPDSIVHLRLAQMLHKTGRYPEAITWRTSRPASWPSTAFKDANWPNCGASNRPATRCIVWTNSILAGESSARC